MWGEELYFDATKVEANASMDSSIPRFAAEAHLGELFEDEVASETAAGDETWEPHTEPDLHVVALPAATDRELRTRNAQKDDWISRDGRPDPTVVRHYYRRKSDYVVSPIDPDASFMQRKGGSTRLGYRVHPKSHSHT